MDLAFTPAIEIARMVRAGDLSPLEVLDDLLARIEHLNPALGAYVALRPEAAREEARRVERAVAAGADPGPLAGVPVSIKELTAVADLPFTLGSRAFADFRLGIDAVLVERLRAAGAVVTGKTNAPEFGARPTTENEVFGASRNPWNPAHTPGGSSGGAAAACAAGLSPLAEGSDGGGSIRLPSAWCGTVGLKPGRGRVSLGPLLSEEWGGLSTSGPITRTVADAALMLDVISGPSTGDPYWAPPPDRPFLSAVSQRPRCRVAVTVERDGIPTHPEIRAAVERTARLLERLGHTVEESAGPPLDGLEERFLTISTVGIGSIPVPPERREMLEERTRLIFEVAGALPATDYAHALFDMHRRCRSAVAFFDRFDVLLTPTCPVPPPRIDEIGTAVETAWEEYRPILAFTWPFNLTGQPAASVPAGFTETGLPIGVQIVGRPADEHTIVSVAAELEEAAPWADHRPPLD